MNKHKKTNRVLAFILALSMVFSLVLPSGSMSAQAATSSKTVKKIALKIGSKNVTKTTYSLQSGKSATIAVTVSPSTAKKAVAFKSSNTSVATVGSKNGKVTAKKVGTAKVTVTVTGKDNKKVSSYVNIKVTPINVSKVTLNKSSLSLLIGASQKLTATVAPSNATTKTIKWSSNNKAVATVSSNGTVKAIKAGSAKITAKSNNGKTATCVVTVKNPASVMPTGLDAKISSTELVVGGTAKVTASVTPSNAVQTLSYASSDSTVAVVSSAGVITAIAPGTTTISVVTSNAIVKSFAVKVSKAVVKVSSVSFDKESYNVDVEKTTPTVVSVKPANAEAEVTYSSADTSVATISKAGIIVGVSAGSTVITATAGGVSATATVVVTTPLKLTLSDEKLSLGRAQEQIITSSIQGVTWTSDNTAVATVDTNGKVKGIAAGTATITASYGDLVATCVVEVSAYDPEKDGTTLSVFNPIKNNDGTIIENTVLVNQDMTIQAYVQNNSTPTKGARVKLSLDEIDARGVSIYGFVIKVNGVQTNTAVTDDAGIAEFTVSYNGSIASTYDVAEDCPYISMSASATVDNQPSEKDIIVKFASIYRSGIDVLNNAPTNTYLDTEDPDKDKYDYDEIIPFVDHAVGDNGIKYTTNTNKYYENAYVSSQQVGEKVYLDAAPYFILPPEQSTSEAKFNVEFPSKTVTTGQSDVIVEGPGKTESYSIYNAYRDLTTTTTIVNVPEGLVSMSVQFSKMNISKYSAIHVDLYDLEGNLVAPWSKTDYVSTNVQDEAVDIPVSNLSGKGVLVVSLESPGQVDVSSTGYVLSKVTGDFNSKMKSLPKQIEVVNSVTWNDVTKDARYTVAEALTYDQVAGTNGYLKEYADVDGSFIKDDSNYTFAYKLPVFNSDSETANAITGNALITATYTAADGTKKIATYAYPCKHALDSSGEGTNTNELVKKTNKVKAIFLGFDVVDKFGNVQNNNGGIEKEGNLAIISSADNNKSGNIFVSATLKIDALAKEIAIAEKSNNYDKSPIKGANKKYPLYSYVQFVAKPEAAEVADKVPTFYAVEDQYIVITAEVKASNGEVQTNQDIEFYKGSKKIAQGDKIGTNVVVKSVDAKTNNEGKAYLVLVGNEASCVEGIEARYEGDFAVFNTYAGNQQFKPVKVGDKKKNICNLYWVDLGLAYQEDVNTPSWKYSFVSDKTVEVSSESKVEKTWKVGFLPIVQSVPALFSNDMTSDKYRFVSISNVSVAYTFENEASMSYHYKIDGSDNCSVTDAGKATLITSNYIGNTSVYGKLKLDSDTFVVKYLDILGEEQSFTTVGVNKINLNSKTFDESIDLGGQIKYTMKWNAGEWQSEFEYPYGKRVYTGQDSVVYFRLHDKFGNPVANTAVNVSAKLDSANYSDITANAKTDENGLIVIEVTAPKKTGSLEITCEIPNVFTKASAAITYAALPAGTAALKANSTATFNKNDTKKIIVEFNNQIAEGLTADQLKKLFVVEDKNGDKLEIADIECHLKNVTITLKDKTFIEGENYKVTVNTGEECKIDGIVHVFSDIYGQAMLSANKTVSYTCAY